LDGQLRLRGGHLAVLSFVSPAREQLQLEAKHQIALAKGETASTRVAGVLRDLRGVNVFATSSAAPASSRATTRVWSLAASNSNAPRNGVREVSCLAGIYSP
jgi:hypothetical protein